MSKEKKEVNIADEFIKIIVTGIVIGGIVMILGASFMVYQVKKVKREGEIASRKIFDTIEGPINLDYSTTIRVIRMKGDGKKYLMTTKSGGKHSQSSVTYLEIKE